MNRERPALSSIGQLPLEFTSQCATREVSAEPVVLRHNDCQQDAKWLPGAWNIVFVHMRSLRL